MSNNKKNIDHRHMGRRQFLIGSGSSFLLLPPLMSLMSEKVAAQVASTPRRRSVLWVQQFGVNGPTIFPATQAGLIQQPGTHIYSKPLSSFAGNISRLIDDEFVSLYPSMNLIQGLSHTGGNYQGHNVGALSGVISGERTPTKGMAADVVMERSTGVYGAGEVIPFKAIRLITNGGAGDDAYSYYMSGSTRKVSSTIQGDKNLFNTLFQNFTAPGGGAASPGDDKLIVDKVYGDLKALQSNARLSKDDKSVLDRFITSVFELQLKTGAGSTGLVCAKPSLSFQATKAGSYYDMTEGWGITNYGSLFDNYIELIRLAFACDLTRVVTVGCTLFDDTASDQYHDTHLHHNLAGGLNDTTEGGLIQADRQKWGLKKFLKLAKALQATSDPSGSGTLLDHSGMMWTQEMGDWTTGHNTLSIPVVTMGSMGGYLKTGNFIDYRQRPMKSVDGSDYYPGRPYKQVLQAMMAGMGVSKSEYMQFGDGSGYGEFAAGINQFGKVVSNAFTPYASEHNDPLPFFVK